MLLGATVGVAIVSELLVGTVPAAARDLGMSELFVGVVRRGARRQCGRALLGGGAGGQDQMDAALAIAVGSSTQIALFVAPVLVFLATPSRRIR